VPVIVNGDQGSVLSMLLRSLVLPMMQLLAGEEEGGQQLDVCMLS
jgi:hypothetical protein